MTDRLDAEAIRSGLAARGEAMKVEALPRCGSTNTELLCRAHSREPALLLADEQTAGRGRRGRRWHSDPGTALMFSMRWAFDGDLARLRGLSLAAGVSIARSLRTLGASGVLLKWPNDLLASTGGTDGAKLGGILVETRTSGGRVVAVIGVGLNYRRIAGLEERLGRRVASLEEALAPLPSRNELAIPIAAGLAQTLRDFGETGFEPFRAGWEALHAHQGTSLRVRTGDGRRISGIADGIAADGGLLLRNRRGLHCIHSGTVVRSAA